MKNLTYSLFGLLLLAGNMLFAQEMPAFDDIRLGNLQSTNVLEKGSLGLTFSTRFGEEQEADLLFIQNYNFHLQAAYGLWEGMHVGLSWESYRNTYAGFLKMQLVQQSDKFPLNVAAYGTINMDAQLDMERYPNMREADRLSYVSQLLFSRRVASWLSLEIAPTFVRQNLVLEPFQKHNQMAVGVGGQIDVSQQISVNIDFIYNGNRSRISAYEDPLTVGLNYKMKWATIQLLASNALSVNAPNFISDASGSWRTGNVFVGFNLTTVF